MDRIKCATCGAESYSDPGRTKLHCSTCYDSAAAALEAEVERLRTWLTAIAEQRITQYPPHHAARHALDGLQLARLVDPDEREIVAACPECGGQIAVLRRYEYDVVAKDDKGE